MTSLSGHASGIGLVEASRGHAAAAPDRPAFIVLDGDAEREVLTYGALDRAAESIAAALGDLERGARVVLSYPPGGGFIAAFLGCLYAGLVPVPVALPKPHRRERQAAAIARDCRAAAILTDRDTAPSLARALAGEEVPPLRVLDHRTHGGGRLHGVRLPHPDEPAFLQYTSGTTGRPRGVVVTHGNLAANAAAILSIFGHRPDDRCVTWLPHHHDMGLIGCIVVPLVVGITTVALSPLQVMHRPALWLRAIHRYGGTISGAPPFAFARCIARIAPEERADCDLSRWRVAFVGAEPVRPEILERFADAFAPCGFRADAFLPCYGLAEATLLAAGVPAGTGIRRRGDAVLCGEAPAGHHLAIVDPETGAAVPDGEEGEIWVSGPSIAAGYWDQPEETAAAFANRSPVVPGACFLRTGDLGRMGPGGLAISGRIKDVVIVAGRNHHAEDIERAVTAACPELTPGGVAAFAVDTPTGEVPVIAVEGPHDRARIVGAARKALAEQFGLALHDVIVLPRGGLPRTTSGKLSRAACRTRFALPFTQP